MNNEEKEILNSSPDFDSQMEILSEEREKEIQRRKWYVLICFSTIMIVTLFVVSYSTLYAYRPYGPGTIQDGDKDNVDIIEDGDKVPSINLTDKTHQQIVDHKTPTKHPNNNGGGNNNDRKPAYNIDYLNNRKPTFNIDVYGDGTFIFNKVNQLDPTGTYCVLNCDSNDDGWIDYNIDLNGDGIPDVNIVKNPKDSKVCDLNCDVNNDTIPEINVDINGDGIPDINVKDETGKPIKNIDYKGDLIPRFNIETEDGTFINPVNDATNNKTCEKNCDLDGDGFPDYNIEYDGSTGILNELIDSKPGNNPVDESRLIDWKCAVNKKDSSCHVGESNTNTYINIDTNGDGVPDVNVSSDKGVTLENPVNKKVTIDGKEVILNRDADNDGFPEYDIDIDNDGIPDMNITNHNNNVCIRNCDTNHDGKPDYLIDYNNNGKDLLTIKDINLDTDFDTKYDLNIDTNGDLYPDVNVDVDKDRIPDVNIDYDHDGIPDFNIDTNGDGIPDTNIDVYGDGICNFNCINEPNKNQIDNSPTCTKNCDTDGDGMPDKNVDVDKDGICDFNCDGDINDKDNNYFKDDEYQDFDVKIDDSDSNQIYITNPLSIGASNIEPGWSQNYIVNITNNSNYAVDYKLIWDQISNEFTTTNNLEYKITKNNASYIENEKAPYETTTLSEKMTLRGKCSAKFLVRITFVETYQNQNIDSGKNFNAKLKISVIE